MDDIVKALEAYILELESPPDPTAEVVIPKEYIFPLIARLNGVIAKNCRACCYDPHRKETKP